MQTQPLDQRRGHLAQFAQLRFLHARILPRRSHDAVGVVEDGDGDEGLFFQRGKVSPNLPLAQSEELGEVPITGGPGR